MIVIMNLRLIIFYTIRELNTNTTKEKIRFGFSIIGFGSTRLESCFSRHDSDPIMLYKKIKCKKKKELESRKYRNGGTRNARTKKKKSKKLLRLRELRNLRSLQSTKPTITNQNTSASCKYVFIPL
jgi:hypothetical protein